jgi:hypothetical protein
MRCRARLPRPDDAAPPHVPGRKRPAHITGWALLFGAYVLFSGVSYVTGLAASADFSPVDLFVLAAAAIGTVAALIVIAGVWHMEHWARIPAILLQIGMLILLVGSLRSSGAPEASASTADEMRQSADLCGAVFWLALNAAYIAWFAVHKEAFKAPDDDA